MQEIKNGIYIQNAYAGVTLGAVILTQGTLLIDAPFISDEARSWKSILLTQSRGMHRLLVNLDEHYDRTLGNRYMDLTILAHKSTAEAFESRSNVFKGQSFDSGSEWEKYPEIIGSRWAQPNITFDNHLHIHWGNQEIHFDHRQGPTRGAIWVELPSEKIVFVGDAVMDNQPPFLASANIPKWLETLSLLKSRKYRDYSIISGRSGLINTETVRNQHAILKSIQGRMETLVKRESSPSDTQKMIPSILSKFHFPPKYQSHYVQRLQHGLHQYFLKNYTLSELSQDL